MIASTTSDLSLCPGCGTSARRPGYYWCLDCGPVVAERVDCLECNGDGGAEQMVGPSRHGQDYGTIVHACERCDGTGTEPDGDEP